MARPIKDGLDYFPLDVQIFEDEKIEAIAGEFGIKGELAVIKLLCAVYKKGYFIVWNDLTQATLLKRLPGVSKEMLNQIVNRLVLWGFFDKELFDSVKVLTSESIQANFFEATKRRKTPKPTKYLVNANNNSQAEVINADINAQSKVKESKVKESKVNKSSSNACEGEPVWKTFLSFQKLWAFPNEFQRQYLVGFIDQYSDDLVDAAIKVAGSKDVKKGSAIAFIDSCLREWVDANADTLEKAREYQRQRNAQNRRPSGQVKPSEELRDWDQYGTEANPDKQKELEEKMKQFLEDDDAT